MEDFLSLAEQLQDKISHAKMELECKLKEVSSAEENLEREKTEVLLKICKIEDGKTFSNQTRCDNP